MDKKKILIVDDERDVLSVLGKRLTEEGYFVITAETGNDAITLAKSKCPDLIVLDIDLPDMHGGEVALKLKENPKTKSIPVIFLSCLYSKTDEVEKGHLIGNNVIFSKPYEMRELLTAIKELL